MLNSNDEQPNVAPRFDYSEKEAREMATACFVQSKSAPPEHLKEPIIEAATLLYMGKITADEMRARLYEISKAGTN